MVVGNEEKLLYGMKNGNVLAGIETLSIEEYEERTDLREWDKNKAFDFFRPTSALCY